MKKRYTGIAIVLIIGILLMYSNLLKIEENHIIKEGKLNLVDSDYDYIDPISLRGEWEYYDSRFIYPEDFTNNNQGLTDYTIKRSERENLFQRVGYREKSYGTFRLKVKVEEDNKYYGIKIKNKKNYLDCNLYVNANAINFYGGVGKAEGERDNLSEIFLNDREEIEIILHISNYYKPFSLDELDIILGRERILKKQDIISNAFEVGVAALSLAIAIYYFSLYIGGFKKKDIFYSVLEFLSLAVIFLFTGERFIYQIFPNLHFEYFIKIQTISTLTMPFAIAGFTNAINSSAIGDKIFKYMKFFYCIYIGILLLTSYNIYIYIIQFNYIPIIILYLIIIARIFIDIVNKKMLGFRKYNRLLYLVCMICVFVYYISSILYSWGTVLDKKLTIVSVLLFITLSQIFLAFRFVINANRLSEMEKHREEFFLKTSYMLNAPLNSIKDTLYNLKGRFNKDNNSNELNIKDTGIAIEIVDNLSAIVNSTLDLTLIQNNQLELSKSIIDVKIGIALVVKSIRKRNKNPLINIIIDITDNLLIEADGKRFRQIMEHLILNAMNSMENGEIVIRARKADNYIHIYVEDNGRGIPSKIQEEIFKPYFSYKSNGFGLGLHISSQLAKYMEGFIDLESSDESGSIFLLALPLGKGEMDKIPFKDGEELYDYPTFSNRDTNKASYNILIVDNEVFNIQTVISILEKENYNVYVAYSGEEAISVVEKGGIDLVILDIMLSGISGISTCKLIRKNHSIIDLPILLSTAVNSKDDLNLGLLAGANDFISKPFIEEKLISRVKTLISLKASLESAKTNELAFLHAQIKPHFIYNTINTIVSFCYTDGEKAADLLTNFSKYLRMVFDIDSDSMCVSIKREIDLVKAYVEIQKARFSDKFEVEYDIEPEVLEKEIPSLIIQPLVENAIRHGFNTKELGGKINLMIRQNDDIITIRVEDNGKGITKEKLEYLTGTDERLDGVGIWNIKRRLSKINDATMEIESIVDMGTVITILIHIKGKVNENNYC